MTRATAERRLDATDLVRIARREPDLERTAGALAVWYCEHRAGHRSATQLHNALTPTLRRRLAGRVVSRSGGTRRRVVHRVLVQHPSADSREAVVLVGSPDDPTGRLTAVCVRFERIRGTWRVAELTAPEDGESPVVTEVDLWVEDDTFERVCA